MLGELNKIIPLVIPRKVVLSRLKTKHSLPFCVLLLPLEQLVQRFDGGELDYCFPQAELFNHLKGWSMIKFRSRLQYY